MGWQDRYADPNWRGRIVKLPQAEEQQFQLWAKNHNAPDTKDYDMRAFWKALSDLDPRAKTAVNANDSRLHFPDTWKTPLHESFSGESIYSNPKVSGPRWNSKDQLVESNGNIVFDEKKVATDRFLRDLWDSIVGGKK